MNQLIILPAYYADRIIACGRPSGLIEVKQDRHEEGFVVDGFTRGRQDGGQHGGSEWVKTHYLADAGAEPRGFWYRADPTLHTFGIEGRRRWASLPLEHFTSGVEGWIRPNAGSLA